ncbi:type II toxin-antitoxin system RelE/ParE family toxin [Tianweitania sp.]|uniref:type II toxin-antitoxin system RelE family toxin n=1 Tax=Tianweitania sp. TaxID=2021634 RepID=UPI002897EF96|nr:type II toxin-antitoxin system RelE/ParE family toxin [Tianweitania sp.]
MGWKVRFEKRAEKDLRRLGHTAQVRILQFIRDRLVETDNPREVGESLHGPLGKYWKYRVGEYRLIAALEDDIVTISIIRVGHRGDVYR